MPGSAHAVFIFWAYVGTALPIAATIIWVLWEHRQTTRRLDQLAEAGVRRRSAAGPSK